MGRHRDRKRRVLERREMGWGDTERERESSVGGERGGGEREREES